MSLLMPPNPATRTDALVDDAWLATLIGKPALRLRPDVDRTDPAVHEALATALRGPSMITAKVATTDIATVQWLASLGFCVVDVNVQLVRECEGRASQPPQVFRGKVRLATADDEKNVAYIAREAFRYDRFHLDPLISEEVARDVKEAWVRNYFSGERGDAMVVAEVERTVEAFLLLLVSPGEGTTIDLIAVDPVRQGRGLAAAMIEFASMFEPRRFVVGTQAANIASIRLYEKLGFRVSSTQYVMHAHGGR